MILFQVFNKILALANVASQQKFASNTWNNMNVSTNSVNLFIYLLFLSLHFPDSFPTSLDKLIFFEKI